MWCNIFHSRNFQSMINTIGDNTATYIPHIQSGRNRAVLSSMPKKITKFSWSALYWIIQISLLVISLSFHTLCNPIVWFLMKAIFNVLTEVFIYLVLGVCSLLISIITHLDDYYTRGKCQVKKMQENKNNIEFMRDGVQVQNCTIKRFVERPGDL